MKQEQKVNQVPHEKPSSFVGLEKKSREIFQQVSDGCQTQVGNITGMSSS